MVNLRQYLPTVYDNNVHMNTVADVGATMLDECISIVEQEKANLFILTANQEGIERFESILGITPNLLTETLEFRRQRVINRFSFFPPFTMEYLTQKLNEIIGVDRWTATLDTKNYTLYIESSAEDQNWYQEILVTIHRIKPANIVFINTPLIPRNICTTEQITGEENHWNYVLGVSWNLGVNAFNTLNDMGVLKMSTTSSINNNLLTKLATFTATDVAKVRINGEHLIETFVTKTNTENTAIIEYDVFTEIGVTAVTSVELLDTSSNVLTSASVYIPLLEDVRLKHTLLIKEG